jgi:thiazole synthase
MLAAAMTDDVLRIGPHSFRSRLFVGTGKYASFEQSCAALEASGAEVVTVAVRRVDFASEDGKRLGRYLTEKKYTILPNTAGCYTTEETVRTARLAREMLGTSLLKLEVIGDPKTLFPDVVQTLEATKVLVAEGFTVLAYTTDDPITARKLEELGCAAVMPLAAPIGSGLGIRNPYNLEIILEQAKVPVVVDAGVGTASDAAIAMEMGCDAVLMNTAIAGAKDPVLMASAMRKGVEAGREAFRAGRIAKRLYATASSPLGGVIGSSRS